MTLFAEFKPHYKWWKLLSKEEKVALSGSTNPEELNGDQIYDLWLKDVKKHIEFPTKGTRHFIWWNSLSPEEKQNITKGEVFNDEDIYDCWVRYEKIVKGLVIQDRDYWFQKFREEKVLYSAEDVINLINTNLIVFETKAGFKAVYKENLIDLFKGKNEKF